MMKYLLVLCGHTAAGKTTLGKKLSKSLNIPFVSEGKIKREMIGDSYTAENSLDEDLRDRGYKKAISVCNELFATEDKVLLDASFHKRFRRNWVKDSIKNSKYEIILIWLFVYCPNKSKVIKRINDRKIAKKEADNQADSIKIYEHIVSTFDEFNETELEENSIMYIFNSDKEIIEKKVTNNLHIQDDSNFLSLLDKFVNEYYLNKEE